MIEKNNQLAVQQATSCLSIIEKNDAIGLIKFVNSISILDAGSSLNQISRVKREQGEDYILHNVIYLLKWLNEAFNKGLSDSIIFEISLSIINDYWFLKLEDIALFCSKFRKGELVSVPYHLEMQHIYKGLQVYNEIRLKAINERHLKIKMDGEHERNPELTDKQRIKSIVEHIDKNINGQDYRKTL